ncbi:DMT family transporter [Xinfangfangia sp. CPCC 101601]|uniref:DMT family transporter n=1 Tax=Pseudogemmobacter lacusdianii TaxID=3069608 RepID=A0ABU0VYN1_9RHOB|nr:DMT family transporter [Xinfangfangia sp. CPCC 101601]MDQ2066859.1 DMT family transporter [Xinfangfangia sp. CPCC 101601]
MMLAVFLSLAAAATFAASGLFIDRVSPKVSALQMARWQNSIGFAFTVSAMLALGSWRSLTAEQMLWLAASSVTGIMLATTTFIATIQLVGARLNALLFTLAVPFAVVLGYMFRGETIGALQSAGVALILTGIACAILGPGGTEGLRKPKALLPGLALGLLTALGQATGNLLARPAMESGAEPFAAMALRSGLGAVFFVLLLAIPRLRPDARPSARDLGLIGGSAVVGIFFGMSLLMAALAVGDLGIVTTLSSTAPILILPMLWAISREPPRAAAWTGAALAVAGTALITLGA